MIKIANVLMWNPAYTDNRSGGVTTAVDCMSKDLREQGFEVDSIHFSNAKTSASIHPAYIQFKKDEFLKLNTYDFIIFNTAGTWTDVKDPWWITPLESINRPFAVGIHDECELKILIYRDRFFSHPYCKLLLPITEKVRLSTAANYLDKSYIVYPMYSTSIKDPSKYFKFKTNNIITLCRMTNRKRIKELVSQSADLNFINYTLDIHGADIVWTYREELKKLLNPYWNYHGTFKLEDKDKICIPARYQWNVSKLKKKEFFNRVEISSVEGLQYGCCQILCKDTVPDWVTEDMAILVDPFDLKFFSDQVLTYEPHAAQMCLNFISKLNEFSTRIYTLTNFIKEVL